MQHIFLLIIILTLTPILIAFAVSADISLTASSKLRLYKLQKEGNKDADLVLQLQDNIGSVSASIHLFETAIQTLSTTFATTLITEMIPNVHSHLQAIIVTVLLTFIVVTYGEIAPVIYVYSQPESIALLCAKYLWRWYKFTSWITSSIETVAKFSLKLLRFDVKHNSKEVDEDELKIAIDLHEGEKPSYEKTILKSILDIKNINVSNIMIHRNKIISVNINDDIDHLINFMIQSSHSRIPVWRDNTDNIIGVIHTKDLIKIINTDKNISKQDLEEILHKPWFIPETTTLFSQMQRFREKHSHIAFVVDEYGSLEGMVTLEDILEEIVGEILDEHDEEITNIVVTNDGRYIIPGDISIRDINKSYNIALPEHFKNISTIGGLIFEVLKKIPKPDDQIRIDGFLIKVLKMHNNKILLTQVSIEEKRI